MYYITKLVYDEYKKAKDSNSQSFITSLNLGKSKTLAFTRELDLIFSKISKISESEIFIYDGKSVFKPLIMSDRLYSLSLEENGHPALYIDGVKMNVGKESSIKKYNDDIIRNLKIDKTDNVLEICTGLGYKTIELANTALKVTSIEKSKDVLELAKLNPYSDGLFKRKNLTLINNDAISAIQKLPDNTFTKILHDPPTFKFAPELYTEELYLGLYRVARDRCLFFHYTGEPGSRFRGKNLVQSVTDKLESSGWRVYKKSDMGIYAIKD